MSINGVKQLKRLVVHYCHWGGSSAHLRAFVQGDEIVRFARENPEIEIVAKKRPGHPFLVAEYLNGKTHEIGIKNKDQKAILSTIYQLRNRSGRDKSTLNYWGRPQTHHPSIQGRWSPVANDASAQQQQQQQTSE
ncbi:Large ribosomal subunit protein mL43 [Plasmodiophora brassicae]|uniref:Large ribosomal subunit protein mL43 n=1 Tax=Plasmodiophora brassicae TaxID=37360 RepID=A0A0G4J5K7_PLABS|nr:hypothetical protein PBRA_002856 [Plasmodiophora brassicae]SPQ94993.1 unnamed protein product [Plasmodiophora brassicae]